MGPLPKVPKKTHGHRKHHPQRPEHHFHAFPDVSVHLPKIENFRVFGPPTHHRHPPDRPPGEGNSRSGTTPEPLNTAPRPPQTIPRGGMALFYTGNRPRSTTARVEAPRRAFLKIVIFRPPISRIFPENPRGRPPGTQVLDFFFQKYFLKKYLRIFLTSPPGVGRSEFRALSILGVFRKSYRPDFFGFTFALKRHT